MATRRIHNENLDYTFQLPQHPKRIVSLLSSATEALDRMGFIETVVGVSEYCDRYIPDLDAPVVGRYLDCDMEKIQSLEPDLILITGGVQRKLGLKLAKAGLPVYLLPLPRSFYGMLENQAILGDLLNQPHAARQLNLEMSSKANNYYQTRPTHPRTVYVELWLGKHMRTIGGGTFIHDLLIMAGLNPIFGDRTDGYFKPDFAEVADLNPDVYLFFHEPEYEISPSQLIEERNWNPDRLTLLSTVQCGKNIIQEGPSFLDTVAWLKNQLDS